MALQNFETVSLGREVHYTEDEIEAFKMARVIENIKAKLETKDTEISLLYGDIRPA